MTAKAADLSVARRFLETGYLALPLYKHRKTPYYAWGRAVTVPEVRPEFTAAIREHSKECTGAAVCLTRTDPYPLLIVDVDRPDDWDGGGGYADMWREAAEGAEMPAGTAVVATVSGGFHYYFRYPGGVRLRHATMLGSLHADLFWSGEFHGKGPAAGHRLTVLPGTVAGGKNHSGKRQYRLVEPGGLGAWLEGSSAVPRLPEPPGSLLEACIHSVPSLSGGATGPDLAKEIPTEVRYVMDNFRDAIPEGERSNAIYRLGVLVGRMFPSHAKNLPESMLRFLIKGIQDKLAEPKSTGEIMQHLEGGLRKGAINARMYGEASSPGGVPTLALIEDECRALWGAVPVAQRMVTSDLKVHGWRITVEQASDKPVVLDVGARDLNAAGIQLSRVMECLPAFTRSPLYSNARWLRAFVDIVLMARATDLEMGRRISDQVVRAIEQEAEVAAVRSRFSSHPYKAPPACYSGSTIEGSYILYNGMSGELETVVLPNRAIERLALQHFDGDMRGKAYGLITEVCSVVRISRHRTRAWQLPVKELSGQSQAAIKNHFASFLKKNADAEKRAS